MERLKHSKIYPCARKCLVGLLIALICVSYFAFGTSAVNIANVRSDITVDQKTTVDNATLWKEISLDYTFVPVTTTTHYILQTASNPRNRTACFPSGMGNISTVEYFDTLCGEVIGRESGSNEVYIRTYIEQITSGNSGDTSYRSGIRISCRIVLSDTVENGSDVTARDIEWFPTVETYEVLRDGLEVNVEYHFISTDSYDSAYWDGFQDGYEQMDASGLSATQTAFGVVSAPINAIATVIQNASQGWFNTPVGEISAWIFGILVIAGAILFIVKVVIGH